MSYEFKAFFIFVTSGSDSCGVSLSSRWLEKLFHYRRLIRVTSLLHFLMTASFKMRSAYLKSTFFFFFYKVLPIFFCATTWNTIWSNPKESGFKFASYFLRNSARLGLSWVGDISPANNNHSHKSVKCFLCVCQFWMIMGTSVREYFQHRLNSTQSPKVVFFRKEYFTLKWTKVAKQRFFRAVK